MSERSPAPRAIEPLNEREIRILWADGKAFALPSFELRFACPCAGCVDEHTGVRTLKRENLPLDIRPTGMEPVGRYAIQVRWSDGHQTGMYAFDRLHELCRSHGRALAS